jgi:hypothetical protein
VLKGGVLAILRGERLLTSPLRALPDFVVIGGQRCGTTSFYNQITRHPTVKRAFSKEVHFFDNAYGRGAGWYRSNFPLRLERRLVAGLRGGPALTGEASPYYIFHPHAARRAAGLVPRAAIIALLRDPVHRAYSHYHHEVRLGTETLSFPRALEAEKERLAGEEQRMLDDERYVSFNHQHFSYAARGRYAEQLERWLACFPRERVLVLSSEDFYADPPGVMATALEFLGLPGEPPGTQRRDNEGRYEGLDSGLRRELAQRFAADNRRLYALLGRDLGWETG